MEIWGHYVLGKTWESEISTHIPDSFDEDEGRHIALEADFLSYAAHIVLLSTVVVSYFFKAEQFLEMKYL